MYCSKVIFEVIFWKIAILFLWSNTFLLSTSKTVGVRGIHVRHCMWLYDVLRTATGGEIWLHVRVGARRLGVNWERLMGPSEGTHIKRVYKISRLAEPSVISEWLRKITMLSKWQSHKKNSQNIKIVWTFVL